MRNNYPRLGEFHPVHHNCDRRIMCDSCFNFERMCHQGGKNLFVFAINMLVNANFYPSATAVFRFLGREKRTLYKTSGARFNSRENKWREEVLKARNWSYAGVKRFAWEPPNPQFVDRKGKIICAL